MTIYDTVTVAMFKQYYSKDFRYLPYYNVDSVYWKGDEVYNVANDTFYESLKDNNTDPLTTTTSWKVVKDSIDFYVTDNDITKAMSQAKINANPRFGSNDDEKITIYLHLVAFYLVLDAKNANAGINASYTGIMASKSVDGVSVSYSIPQFLMNNPMYSIYAQNGFGLKYLSLIAPFLACTILFSPGGSTIG